MTVLIVQEYTIYNTKTFAAAYKKRLLPRLRTAPGFRHVQLVQRATLWYRVLILLEFDRAIHYERYRNAITPTKFPRPQDLISEELLWALPNTGVPREKARHHQLHDPGSTSR